MEASIRKMKESRPDLRHYYFLRPELDTFVHRLMNQEKLTEALEIFLLLADLFPESHMAFDSRGEVCLRKGDKENAKKYLIGSLEIGPENQNAEDKLQELKKENRRKYIQGKGQMV